MAGGPVEAAAWLAHEDAVFFDQEPASLSALTAAEPWTLPLRTSNTKGLFHLDPNDLRLTINGDGDLSSSKTPDP